MCAIFGLIDYAKCLTLAQRTRMIRCLAQECELRGSDATGIAYNNHGHLAIHKAPVPGSEFRFALPKNAYVIHGHTRAATQGDATINRNNHPFRGSFSDGDFALAHNGIIQNDVKIRKGWGLPATRVQTDSYIAVQMLEHLGSLAGENLAKMAETLFGSFMITILSQDNISYFIRGANPITIYHFADPEFYVYASTQAILDRALAHMHLNDREHFRVKFDEGEILTIQASGKMYKQLFDYIDTWGAEYYGCRRNYDPCIDETLDYVYSLADYFHVSYDVIDELLSMGYRCDAILDMLDEAGGVNLSLLNRSLDDF